MPLSEEEMRLLEQMERALVADDPKLASTLRGTRLHRRARRHVIGGVVGFLAGVTLLMTGAVLPNIPLGVLGFVIMLAAAYFTLTSWRGRATASTFAPQAAEGGPGLRVVQGGKARKAKSAKPAKQAKAPKQGTMMERFEERWRRRREQGGM